MEKARGQLKGYAETLTVQEGRPLEDFELVAWDGSHKSPPQKMLSGSHPDRIHVAFDDYRLVANAGLLLPVTLGRHLGLPQLVDQHLGLGDGPGRANTGDKVMTLVASALAGGDCIDDADVLCAGGTAGAIGCVVKAPSTLGTFLFRS